MGITAGGDRDWWIAYSLQRKGERSMFNLIPESEFYRRIGAVLEDAIALSNTGIIEFSSHQEGLILGAWNRVRRDNPHLVRYVRAANLERLPNLPGRRFLVIHLKGGVSHG